MDSGLCIYHLFVCSNLNFLYNSQWIAFPTQSCLVLYFFCTNLLNSFIMWLIFSSLSPRNLHLLFCCVMYFCFYMAFFCVVIRRNSVSLLLFPFLSHVQVFSCEISLVFRLFFLPLLFSIYCYSVDHVLFVFTVISLSLLFFM